MSSENFEAMINKIKEGNLETILKMKKIIENNFNTIKNDKKNFKLSDSKELERVKDNYSKIQNILLEYKKSIDNYWDFVKETYLPIVKNNEKNMSN